MEKFNVLFKELYVVGDEQREPENNNGATFIPSVSKDGVLSWTNDGDLPNPAPVNLATISQIGNQITIPPHAWRDDTALYTGQIGREGKQMRVGFRHSAGNSVVWLRGTGNEFYITPKWQTFAIKFALGVEAPAFGVTFCGGGSLTSYVQPYDFRDVALYAAADEKKKNLLNTDIEEQQWRTTSEGTDKHIEMTDGIKYMHVFQQDVNYTQIRMDNRVPVSVGEYVLEFKMRLSPWVYWYIQTALQAEYHSENSLTVSPTRDTADVYKEHGIYCAAFGNYSIIFACESIPQSDVVINTMIHKASGTQGLIFQPH